MLGLGLDRAAAVPLYRQLYDTIRAAILAARLRPGARLPSTRALATELGSSRNTVLAAFQQLLAEGYVEGRVGSGTSVARTLPEALLPSRPTTARPSSVTGRSGRRPRLARGAPELRASPLSPGRAAPEPRPFRPGVPAYDAFPFDRWGRLVARRWRGAPRQLLDYGEPAGYGPLREAIATYLREARAV